MAKHLPMRVLAASEKRALDALDVPRRHTYKDVYAFIAKETGYAADAIEKAMTAYYTGAAAAFSKAHSKGGR